jgi:hypothetical protein
VDFRFSAFLLVHRICIDATEAPDVVTRGNFDGVEEKAAAHRAESECRIDVQDGQFTGRNSISIHIQLEICTPLVCGTGRSPAVPYAAASGKRWTDSGPGRCGYMAHVCDFCYMCHNVSACGVSLIHPKLLFSPCPGAFWGSGRKFFRVRK